MSQTPDPITADLRLMPASATDGHAAGTAPEADAPTRTVRAQRAHLLWIISGMVLCPVAGIGAALSFQSLHEAAEPIFGPLAAGFPLLVDMLILGSTLAYLAGAAQAHPRSGWRWTAHGGVAGTLLLNALAATTPATIPWHITPALVWSVLVEMTARQVTTPPTAATAVTPGTDAIPTRLWITQPRTSARLWLHMARTGHHNHRHARTDLAVLAAATHALQTAMPHRRQRRARDLLRHQLRDGALDPATVLHYLHNHHHLPAAHPLTTVIHTVLTDHAHPTQPGTSGPPTPPVIDPGPPRPAPTPGDTPPARDQKTPPQPTRSPRSSARHQAALTILRAYPTCDSTHMETALAEQGWVTSPRTARRILAHAHHELAATAPTTADQNEP